MSNSSAPSTTARSTPHGINPTPRTLVLPEKTPTNAKEAHATCKAWAAGLQEQVNELRVTQHAMSCDMVSMKEDIDAQLLALEARTNEAINDTKRQYTKRCLTLAATMLPKREPGEKPFKLLSDYAKKNHGIVIDPTEIGAVHRMGNGALIASFIHTHEDSAFFRLKNPHRNPHHPQKGAGRGLRPDFLLALTESDHEVRKALRFIREKDAAKDKNPATWRVWRINSSLAGRVGYTMYPTNELFTLEGMRQVREMMTEMEVAEWTAQNEAFQYGREKQREAALKRRLEAFKARKAKKIQEKKDARGKSAAVNQTPMGKKNKGGKAAPASAATSGAQEAMDI